MSENLRLLLEPLQPFITDPAVEEICLNGPGAAFIWRHGAFEHHPVALDHDDMIDIGICAGAQRRQDVGPDMPLLGTDIPGIGRLQVVLPPCAAPKRPCLTLRRGSSFMPTTQQLDEAGLFARTVARRGRRTTADAELATLYEAGQWRAFLERAVAARKTIVIAGATGSGKTTLAKALIQHIPLSDRLITVEDTPEWTDLPHPNWVALYYAEGGQDRTGITAAKLVKAALRMRIGRLLIQELRDGEAVMAFLLALQSGHPGGITTIHASGSAEAFDRMRVLIKQEPAGAAVSDADIMTQLRGLIDVVVHCARDGQEFTISEVWYGDLDG